MPARPQADAQPAALNVRGAMSERSRSRMIGLSLLAVDRASGGSLRRQLYARLTEAIHDGSLREGARLPSTRAIAAALSISRATVADVFEQLLAESYLVARHGSGTYVAPRNGTAGREAAGVTTWERASQRGRLFAGIDVASRLVAKQAVAFQPGIPALDHFPFETWSRLAGRVMRRPSLDAVSYGDPAGYRPLREAIAAQLRARSGINCGEERIVIVGGSQQALDLICRLVLDPGDRVWLEDPASASVRGTLLGTGAEIVPVPVDEEGLDVAAGEELAPDARMAHVTSAHQWPTGVTMSQPRREALLAWAEAADAWIVEDEYDGIFRYDGSRPRPLAALDTRGRVCSVGSFSVTTFPAVRIGYLVSPPGLVDAFIAAKSVADRQTSTLEQAILAEFIFDGHYARHLTRMQEVYAERRERLVVALDSWLGVRVEAPPSGMHLTLPLAEGQSDVGASERIARSGHHARPLSTLYQGTPRSGLVLGFAVARREENERAVRAIARALDARGRARPRLHRAARDVPG
jgi:GntR family transcriptional regulator/MocR family aminotransferase